MMKIRQNDDADDDENWHEISFFIKFAIHRSSVIAVMFLTMLTPIKQFHKETVDQI